MSFRDLVSAELAQISGRLLELHEREIAEVRRECRATCAQEVPQLFKDKYLVSPGRPNTPRGDECENVALANSTMEAIEVCATQGVPSTSEDMPPNHRDLCVSAFGEAMSMQGMSPRSVEQVRSSRTAVTTKQYAVLHIECAYGLRDADHMLGQGLSDPYCICKVTGKAAAWAFKTQTISDNLNPVWDHFEEFALDGDAWDYLLEFQVMDSDIGKSDDLLGSACLPLAACYPDGFNERLFLDEDGEAQLQVKVQFFNDDSEEVVDMMARSREHWNISLDQQPSANSTTRPFMASHRRDTKRSFNHRMKGTGVLDRFVAAPNSFSRITWDISSLLSILYDAFTIPAMFAFDVQPTTGMLIGSCIITLYWTIDIVFNFFTGYTVHGVIETRFRTVARRYMKGWFVIDLAVVLTDLVFIAAAFGADGLSPGSRLIKVSRASKAIKLVPLLRVTKISIHMPDIFQHYSETVLICSHLIERLLCIIALTHFICCIWYAIGVSDDDASTWVRKHGIISDSFACRYVISFDWALAQFTPSPTDIHPQNVRERAFKIVVDFCGLVTFSSFISTITSRMARLRSMKAQKTLQQSQLWRYLAVNRVPLDLSRRVIKVFNEREQEQSIIHVREQELSFLEGLPERLLQELRLEVRMPHVLNHPFFKFFNECDAECIYEVCHKYVQDHIVMRGHEIFLRDILAKHMVFVASGRLLYRRRGKPVNIDEGGWLSEACIWITSWIHRGDAVASSVVRVMNLEAVQLQTLMMSRLTWPQMYPAGIDRFIKTYVSSFIRDGESALVERNEHLFCSDVWSNAERLCFYCQSALKAAGRHVSEQNSRKHRVSDYLRSENVTECRSTNSSG